MSRSCGYFLVATLILFSSQSNIFADAQPTTSQRAYSLNIGQIGENFLFGINYFHAFSTDSPNENVVRQYGLRVDLDMIYLTNYLLNAAGEHVTENAGRVATYLMGHHQIVSAPVWCYGGFGFEMVRAQRLWKRGNSFGIPLVYGLEVDIGKAHATDKTSGRVFVEGVAHIGHERADLLPEKPHVFFGTSFRTGVRVPF